MPYPKRYQYLGIVTENKRIVFQMAKQDMKVLSLKKLKMQDQVYSFQFTDVNYLSASQKYQVELKLDRDLSFLSQDRTILLKFNSGHTTIFNEIKNKWKGWFD